MARVTRQVKINAPTEDVWKVLADFGGIHKWNPGVSDSYSTSEMSDGEGATRHCDLENPSGYLEERVVEWRDGEGYTIDVYEASVPVERNVVEFAVSMAGDSTIVSVTADYRLKYGPIGTLFDFLFARRQLVNGFGRLLAGLKHHVETGEVVTEGTELPQSALAAVS